MENHSFGTPSDYASELRNIISLVKELRNKKEGKETCWREAAEWHMKYSNIDGVPSLALTITLSPTGCDWARQGGCTMCGEFEGALKRNDLLENPQFHIAQFVSSINNPEVWEMACKEEQPISWLRINQEGSFTNPKEMNVIAQRNILMLATKIKGLKRVTIESRPQYLSEEVVSSLAGIFRNTGVRLEIGMGVEAQDDVVRNICINKPGTKEDFRKTVNLLKKYDVLPLAYILLKPAFLTEKEAIDEAVKTAHFASEIGFSRISFEPVSIHQYTLVDLLREAGCYEAPWLWSVIEVTKQCADISNILGIGGVGYYPIPAEYAHNRCQDPECEKRVIDAIMKYNISRDVSIFDGLSCDCLSMWKKCLNTEQPALKKRINDQLLKAQDIIEEYHPKPRASESPIRGMRILAGGSQK